MNSICRDIFKAIHEGKWLEIEYLNKHGKETRYWIGIKDINVVNKSLDVEAMHLGLYSVGHYQCIYIDSILSSKIIDSSYFAINQTLIDDIQFNPQKYKVLFENSVNLKVLNYLEMCNKLDTTPYYSDFTLVHALDRDSFTGEFYRLTEEQFKEFVDYFRYDKDKKKRKDGSISTKRFAMNVLSLYTSKGLYVLAYRRLKLDIIDKCLRPSDDITVCIEFTIDEKRESIRKFLDADDYELLNDFEKNQEIIKDKLTREDRKVDDMPYVIEIGADIILDLHEEYNSIVEMYQSGEVTFPIRAFFGDLLERPRRSKAWPIALVDNKVNLDQLLAIDNAMKYPLAYIQGPPGTGKTSTIINTIITAFFNERTVLFSSYNNRPIDGVFKKLVSLKYQGYNIPFPVLMLGNYDKVLEALDYIKNIYESVKNIEIPDTTLDKKKEERKERAKRLSEYLREYNTVLDLEERKEAIKRVLDYQKNTADDLVSFEGQMFSYDLSSRQLTDVEREINQIGDISEEKALNLLDNDQEDLYQYLLLCSAKYIKRLSEKKYESLMKIVNMGDKKEKFQCFCEYLSDSENVKQLQRVFPIILTTCISAHRLGGPKPLFDMVIIDEASQCNVAISLVPILRGENLMLVGDPQQLNPVILLDDNDNERLKKRYQISNEYDYKNNSIYKAYLANDSVSDEVLLRNHYRCDPKIIGFNNKKYYNSKLEVKTSSKEPKPLVLCDVQDDGSNIKNASKAETDLIVQYVKAHKDKKIGIITPFVNQKKMIDEELKCVNLDVPCGTVHTFQGDEKDIIIFASAITQRTTPGTYSWLKNNKELINVATSRAKDKLVVLTDINEVERLHNDAEEDDFYELIKYVQSEGVSTVSPKSVYSRALGIKPFSTETEEAFLQSLSHAMSNIWSSTYKYRVRKEVPISQVFENNATYIDLFYTGRFDFVIYEKVGSEEFPILAIELDGKEHCEDKVVKQRDAKKNAICVEHNLQLIRVENSYARRYNYIKDMLLDYFGQSKARNASRTDSMSKIVDENDCYNENDRLLVNETTHQASLEELFNPLGKKITPINKNVRVAPKPIRTTKRPGSILSTKKNNN